MEVIDNPHVNQWVFKYSMVHSHNPGDIKLSKYFFLLTIFVCLLYALFITEEWNIYPINAQCFQQWAEWASQNTIQANTIAK